MCSRGQDCASLLRLDKAAEGLENPSKRRKLEHRFTSARLQTIQKALCRHTPLATVLQELVVEFARGADTLLVADQNNGLIRAFSLHTHSVSTFAGATGQAERLFWQPCCLAVHSPSHTLLVGAYKGCCIRRVSLDDRRIGLVSGTPGVCDYAEGTGYSSQAKFGALCALTVVGSDLLVCDSTNHCLRKVPLDGSFSSLVAGVPGDFGCTDGVRGKGKLHFPCGVVASAGTLFIADYNNDIIRMVQPSGAMTTVAGSCRTGHVDGPAHQAEFCCPSGVAVDNEGNLLVVDSGNHCVRHVNLQTRTVSTVAGRPEVCGHLNGPAHKAMFNGPQGLAFDADTGAMYLSCCDHTIRKVSQGGTVSTLCGIPGQSGCVDGDLAKFDEPAGLVLLY